MTSDHDARRQKLLDFVREHASKEPDALKELLTEGHEQLVSAISALSTEQAAWKPAPDEWSALEAMSHITEVKEGVTKTCVALAAGEAPPPVEEALVAEWIAKGYSGEPFASPAAAVEAAEAAHAAMLAFLESISDATSRSATHDHPFVGPMNCVQWAVFQRAHDADHASQVTDVQNAEGFPS